MFLRTPLSDGLSAASRGHPEPSLNETDGRLPRDAKTPRGESRGACRSRRARRRLEDVVEDARDQSGGDGHQDDVVAGMDITVAARRRPKAVNVRIAHVVVAVGGRQVVAALPAIAVIARLDPVVAVAGRVPVAVAAAGVVTEVVAAAPPVTIVAGPATFLPVLPAILAALLTILAAVAAALSLGRQRGGGGRQRQGDDSGSRKAVHDRSPVHGGRSAAPLVKHARTVDPAE